GRNLPRLEHYMGQASLAGALLVALIVGLVLGWRWFERNRTSLVTRTEHLRMFAAARFARGQYLGLHLTVGLAISLAGLWLFAGVTEDVIHHDPLTQFDVVLLDWLHARATPTGYAVFNTISSLGSAVTLTVLALAVGYVLTLLWIDRRSAQIAVVLGTAVVIAAIGISRLYLGVHYFSDVVGGYAAGVLWLSACISGLDVARRWGAGQPPAAPSTAP